MCGESWLATKILTHHPSSQGWASRHPLLYMFVCLGYGRVGYFTFLFLSLFLKLMCYAHVFPCTCTCMTALGVLCCFALLFV